MLLPKTAAVAVWSGFPNLFPCFPLVSTPSCKHIWDAMVGLVSAFGGKDFSTACFWTTKTNITILLFLFKETFLSGVKI